MDSNNITLCIENILNESFSPQVISVTNESHMHNVPDGSESHFKLLVVSDSFIDLSLVKRHQLVYKCLKAEMKLIHALSMHLYTKSEYDLNPDLIASPECVN